MNHLDNGTTPFDKEDKMIECPQCLGMKEVFESDDEEGLTGEMITCPLCDGTGEVPDDTGYTKMDDFLDDQADDIHDNYMLSDEDQI